MIAPIYKPAGWTSFDVVKKIRNMSGVRKVGHAGTLDPFAEGVLILGLGESTKLLSKYSAQSKEYEAVLKLGSETDTLDIDGSVIKNSPVPQLTEELIRTVLDKFTGHIEQIPPMYSAKKVNGTRLYKLARQNIEVKRKPVRVEIKSLILKDFLDDTICFSVECSKGTYIRQLGADIANALNTVGHLISLKRIRVGNIRIEDCTKIEDFNEKWMSIEA